MPKEPVIPDTPDISVVIPHLNEPNDLERCLAALASQRHDGIGFEVIVVDNGSRELPTHVTQKYPWVRLAQELTPGPGPARNCGARLAQGGIVAFIDCDCLAQSGWLRGIFTAFAARDDLDVLGGAIGVQRKNPARPTALELYETRYGYRVQLYVERDHYAATGNMAVRRHVFWSVGPFGGIGLMEDLEWGQRARAMGFRLAYAPEVRVMTPACKSFGELARRWDRHVAHEYSAAGRNPISFGNWLLRIGAVAASPALEAGRIIMDGRGLNLGDRARLFTVLAGIRAYRVQKMLSLAVNGRSARIVNAWNRE